MPFCHRIGDDRICGAKTTQQGQMFLTVDGQLWAVKDDPNDHGNGNLIPTQHYVFINGLEVILKGDHAKPDKQCKGDNHCDPIATGFDPLIDVQIG